MKSLAAIAANLEARLVELNDHAIAIDETLDRPADDDRQENATESEQDEVLEGLGELAVAEIRQVQLALARIEAGSYGKCASCGEAIAVRRLEALPYATSCVACADAASG